LLCCWPELVILTHFFSATSAFPPNTKPCSRLRRFDETALRAVRREARFGAGAELTEALELSPRGDQGLRTRPEPGLPLDYCVFCHHGPRLLRPDNTVLLSRLVSERGGLLPKRFTKACAKHQRELSRVVQRARWLNLLPYHSKLHPRLRFTSMRPDILRESATAGIAAPAAGPGAGGVGGAVAAAFAKIAAGGGGGGAGGSGSSVAAEDKLRRVAGEAEAAAQAAQASAQRELLREVGR
jgi:small subunit ribosomal protein S18